MRFLTRGLRLKPLAFVCGVVLFVAASSHAEKVPKPEGSKETPSVNRTGEAYWGSKWYPVQILEEKDGKFLVHYDTYTDASNEWVTKDRVRFPEKAQEEAKCEVEWHGKWFPAHVIDQEKGQWKIKYDDYGDNWNEWVGKERIRFPAKAEKKDAPAKQPGKKKTAKAAKQTKAEVLWSGTWYAAQVLEEKEGKFHIKYDGYSDNWNEWVGEDRIRLVNNDKKPGPKDPGDKQNDER